MQVLYEFPIDLHMVLLMNFPHIAHIESEAIFSFT